MIPLDAQQDSWNIEVTDHDEWPGVAALRLVNPRLVTESEIYKTSVGQFFFRWEERHPEMISSYEFFGDREDSIGPRSAAALTEWHDLARRLPVSHHVTEISRKEAWQLIAYFWLPSEFHPEAGLPPASGT